MPENHHAREDDDRNYYHNDGKPLPALLLLTFVLREIEILVIKLVHLAAYYTKTECKFFASFWLSSLERRSLSRHAIRSRLFNVPHDAALWNCRFENAATAQLTNGSLAFC